jgi:hypothetical protein
VRTIFSGFGVWNGALWILFFLFALAGAWAFRRGGRSDYRAGTGQDEIFYGGNPADDPDALGVPASAAYSGFRQALSPYYRLLSEIHDGDATRSPLGLVVVAALLAALLSVWRG